MAELSDILRLAEQEEKAAQTNLNQLGQVLTTQADLTAKIGDSQARQTELNTQITVSAAQKKLEAEQTNLKAAETLGTLPGAGSDIVTGLLNEIRTGTAKVNELEEEVADLAANSSITNPVGFLRNLLVGPLIRKQYEAEAFKLDSDLSKMSKLNATTSQTAAANNAIAQSMNAADIDKLAQAGQEAANVQRLLAAKESLGYGVQLIEAMRTMGAQQFNRALQMYQVLQEDKRYKETAELRQLQLDEARTRIVENKETKEDLAQGLAFTNYYRISNNLPELSSFQYKRLVVASGEEGDNIRRQERLGMNSYYSKGTQLLGSSPAEAWESIIIDNPNLPPAVRSGGAAVLEQANDAVNLVINGLSTGTGQLPEGTETFGLTQTNLKDSKAVRLAINKAASTVSENLQLDLTKANNTNPYQAPPMQNVFKEFPQLLNSNFGQQVFKPMMDAGIGDTDAQKILEWTFKALDQNKIQFNEARDALYNYFEGAVAINNATKGFTRVGLSPQQGYRVKVGGLNRVYPLVAPISGVYASKAIKTFDLTNRTEVNSALAFRMTEAKVEQINSLLPRP